MQIKKLIDKARHWERWQINLATLWVTQVISLTSFGFGLPFMPYFIQELGITQPVTINLYTGILSAAPAITMALMSPVWGFLSDRFGQKLMIQRAMLAAFFIIGGMGFSQAIWHLVALRLLQGLFTGTITASSTFVAVNTPNHKLSFALGFLSSSTFIGYSLGPWLGGMVAEQFGYRMSFWVGALLMLVGFVLVTVFLRQTVPIGKKEGPKTQTSLKNLNDDVQFGDSQKTEPMVSTTKVRGAFSFITYSIGLMLLMLFFHRILRTVFTPFIPLYVQEITGTKVGAAALTGSINGLVGFVTALSAVFISRLGDKYAKLPLIKVMLMIAFFIAIGVNFTNSLMSFTILYTAIFFVIGGVEPLITSMTAEQTDPGRRGALFGIQGLVGSLGWMVSPVIGTYISIAFNYSAILWSLVALTILSYGITVFVTLKVGGGQPPNGKGIMGRPAFGGDDAGDLDTSV